MPPFWVGFSKQRKKPGSRKWSNCVQNAFCYISPSGETKKHPWDRILKFRFHATILGGLFQAAEKAGLTKVLQLRSKRVFSTFPILARQKKQRWDQILQFRFHATILGGLFQAAEKAGLTKVVQLRSKRVFSTFPILARQKKKPWDQILQFQFHATILGGLFQAAEKAGLTKVVQLRSKRVFSTFPILARQKKKPWDQILQFRFHATILCGLFQAAEKAGLTKVLQLRSKRVFSTFPIGAKRKNSLGIEFYNFGFIPPFWVGFSKQRKKLGWRRSSNCVQNAFFQLFPSWPDKKKSREIKFYNFGFMPPFCVGFSKQRKKPGWRRSSNCVQNAFFQLSRSGRSEKTALGSNFTISVSFHRFGWAFPSSGKSWVQESGSISFKTRFVKFPHRGETKKQPWDRILKFRFHATILCGLFQAAEKAGFRKVVQSRSKRVLLNFPIGGKPKNSLGIEF